MAETGSVPAVAPLWCGKDPAAYAQDVKYVGQELADLSYPIKSFFDAGANVVFHSDFPVSPLMDIKVSIYMAETRAFPKYMYPGDTQCGPEEAITREQSLRAMTVNVAHARLLDELERRDMHPGFHMSFDGLGWHDWLRGVEGAERGYACCETSTDYLGIDEEVCHFFQSGWYEKAVELRDKYRELCFPPVEEEQKQE
jgi:hypothetical protein